MAPFGLDPRVWHALLLTSLGAAGTALGGLIVVVQPKFSFRKLGYLQGCAAGLMLSISFFDLFPESVEAVGELAATVWFFIGSAFFAVVVALIPEPDSNSLVVVDDADEDPAAAAGVDKSAAGGAKGGDHQGSPTAARKRPTNAGKAKDSVVAPAQDHRRPTKASKGSNEARRKVLLSGLITALGIALHNFPEGVAVFLASIKSTTIGLSLAIAIAMHNVPEGVAVALPVYFATGSRLKGFAYAAVSGLAEPAAVLVLGVLLRAFWLDKAVIDCLLAAVSGIMAFLSLHELLPLAIEHAGHKAAVTALFIGMAIMSANLQALAAWLGDAH